MYVMVPPGAACAATGPRTPAEAVTFSIPGKTIETGSGRLLRRVTVTVSPWLTIRVGPGYWTWPVFPSAKPQKKIRLKSPPVMYPGPASRVKEFPTSPSMAAGAGAAPRSAVTARRKIPARNMRFRLPMSFLLVREGEGLRLMA